MTFLLLNHAIIKQYPVDLSEKLDVLSLMMEFILEAEPKAHN